MKKKITIIALVILLIVIVSQIFSKDSEPEYKLVTVERGDVSSEIAETGQVKKGEKINLSFGNSGEVENVYVEAGDAVRKGDLLMKLDTNSLSLQLKEAQASLNLAQITLDKLLAGPTATQVQVYQTSVDNMQIALNVAKQSLVSGNEDALDSLEDAYLKSYNAYIEMNDLQLEYFNGSNQSSINVKENRNLIYSAVNSIQDSKNSVNIDSPQAVIDSALENVKNRLSEVSASLATIRGITENADYRTVVSSTDKTAVDTHRSYINAVITALITDMQAIDAAELSITTAQGNLQAAQNNLALQTADPRKEDVEFSESQVAQAKAQVDLINDNISNSYLRSPVAGEVAEILKRTGELAQASFQDTAVVVLPNEDFEIEVNIYEEDIVNLAIGNPVSIVLVAFPKQEFLGEVISIDPAENIVDGVVYYKVSINFNDAPEGIKSGMTADVVIKPEIKQNVIFVPEEAILEMGEKTIVKVYKDGAVEEREVVLGLEGEDNTEIISGLEEGEQIILD